MSKISQVENVGTFTIGGKKPHSVNTNQWKNQKNDDKTRNIGVNGDDSSQWGQENLRADRIQCEASQDSGQMSPSATLVPSTSGSTSEYSQASENANNRRKLTESHGIAYKEYLGGNCLSLNCGLDQVQKPVFNTSQPPAAFSINSQASLAHQQVLRSSQTQQLQLVQPPKVQHQQVPQPMQRACSFEPTYSAEFLQGFESMQRDLYRSLVSVEDSTRFPHQNILSSTQGAHSSLNGLRGSKSLVQQALQRANHSWAASDRSSNTAPDANYYPHNAQMPACQYGDMVYDVDRHNMYLQQARQLFGRPEQPNQLLGMHTIGEGVSNSFAINHNANPWNNGLRSLNDGDDLNVAPEAGIAGSPTHLQGNTKCRLDAAQIAHLRQQLFGNWVQGMELGMLRDKVQKNLAALVEYLDMNQADVTGRAAGDVSGRAGGRPRRDRMQPRVTFGRIEFNARQRRTLKRAYDRLRHIQLQGAQSTDADTFHLSELDSPQELTICEVLVELYLRRMPNLRMFTTVSLARRVQEEILRPSQPPSKEISVTSDESFLQKPFQPMQYHVGNISNQSFFAPFAQSNSPPRRTATRSGDLITETPGSEMSQPSSFSPYFVLHHDNIGAENAQQLQRNASQQLSDESTPSSPTDTATHCDGQVSGAGPELSKLSSNISSDRGAFTDSSMSGFSQVGQSAKIGFGQDSGVKLQGVGVLGLVSTADRSN